jgi:hypothetical protein
MTDTPEFPDTEEVTGSNPVRPTRHFLFLALPGSALRPYNWPCSERYSRQVVVGFSLENSPGDLGLDCIGLAITSIALSAVVPRSASPLRSYPQFTSDAADGWEELCRHALPNTRRCLETIRADPRSGAGHDRQHRLHASIAA